MFTSSHANPAVENCHNQKHALEGRKEKFGSHKK